MITPFVSPKPAPPAPSNRELNCEGSGQPPKVVKGKPVCPVCGRRFRWQDIENQVTQVPEHG